MFHKGGGSATTPPNTSSDLIPIVNTGARRSNIGHIATLLAFDHYWRNRKSSSKQAKMSPHIYDFYLDNVGQNTSWANKTPPNSFNVGEINPLMI